ncbi:hypothetical protein VP01_4832g1, partial [Puccinia sorghi]
CPPEQLSSARSSSGARSNNLFSVDNPDQKEDSTQSSANFSTKKEPLMEIHEKLCHASLQHINPFLDGSINKAEKDAFEYLIGPINPESSLKHQLILRVVDNHSGYLAGFPLVHKEDTMDALINLLETKHHKRGCYPRWVGRCGSFGYRKGESLQKIHSLFPGCSVKRAVTRECLLLGIEKDTYQSSSFPHYILRQFFFPQRTLRDRTLIKPPVRKKAIETGKRKLKPKSIQLKTMKFGKNMLKNRPIRLTQIGFIDLSLLRNCYGGEGWKRGNSKSHLKVSHSNILTIIIECLTLIF